MSARAVSTASEVALRETLKYYEISTWVLAGFVVLLTIACIVGVKIYMISAEQKEAEANLITWVGEIASSTRK